MSAGTCRTCGGPVARFYVTYTRWIFPAYCSTDCARAGVLEPGFELGAL